MPHSLSPCREHVQTHVQGEQRALWEHELVLDADQRERLKLHLLELKNGRYRCLFSRYNGATLVLELLAVARPEMPSEFHAWVTPKEVVRIAQRYGIIGDGLTVGWRTRRGEPDRLRLRWLPVPHHLEDDNRGFLDESELRMFEGTDSVSTAGTLRVDAVTLFSALSLRPWDALTRPLSSHFEIGWQEVADRDLRVRHALDVTLGRGLTARLHRDVDVFAMLLGAAHLGHRSRLAAQPELGVVMRLAFDMKAVLAWRGEGTADRPGTLRLGYSWFVSPRAVLKVGRLEERGRMRVRRSSTAELMWVS